MASAAALAPDDSDSQAGGPTGAAEGASDGVFDGERVDLLVVDNDTDYAAIVARFMGSRGISVALAWSGSGAVEKVKSTRPRLVLLDIDLPDFDGIEVAERLSTLDDPPRIVLMSGYHDRVHGALKSSALFQAAVDKPVPLGVLAASMQRWLAEATSG